MKNRVILKFIIFYLMIFNFFAEAKDTNAAIKTNILEVKYLKQIDCVDMTKRLVEISKSKQLESFGFLDQMKFVFMPDKTTIVRTCYEVKPNE